LPRRFAAGRARALAPRRASRVARGGMDYLWGALGLSDDAPAAAEEEQPAPGAGNAAAPRDAPPPAARAPAAAAPPPAPLGGGGASSGALEGDDAADAARRAKAAALTSSRQAAWASEAAELDVAPMAQEDTGDEGLEASMAALQSALRMESAVRAPAPVATGASAAQAAAAAAALAQANALLGPGAGGILPSAASGAQAWDEMEARMAALTAAIEGDSSGLGSPLMDAAKVEARAARMRERENKRAMKRQALAGEPVVGIIDTTQRAAPPVRLREHCAALRCVLLLRARGCGCERERTRVA
jgi:hypothetical protein